MAELSLYESVMGSDFLTLDPAVQVFHRLEGIHELQGTVRTDAPASWAARILARCLGTPRTATRGNISFRLEARPGSELWIRRFPQQTMSSRLQLDGGRVTEKLGLARLQFALSAVNGTLEMRIVKLCFLGIPCPLWALPRIVAEEHGHRDRLYFNVSAALPLIGKVAGYSGYLTLPGVGANARG